MFRVQHRDIGRGVNMSNVNVDNGKNVFFLLLDALTNEKGGLCLSRCRRVVAPGGG